MIRIISAQDVLSLKKGSPIRQVMDSEMECNLPSNALPSKH